MSDVKDGNNFENAQRRIRGVLQEFSEPYQKAILTQLFREQIKKDIQSGRSLEAIKAELNLLIFMLFKELASDYIVNPS